MPVARRVSGAGLVFLKTGRSLPKIPQASCKVVAATGRAQHSATQCDTQHAPVAASSDNVPSTLGAARTSCSSAWQGSAMGGTRLCPQARRAAARSWPKITQDHRASPLYVRPLALRGRAAALGVFARLTCGLGVRALAAQSAASRRMEGRMRAQAGVVTTWHHSRRVWQALFTAGRERL